MDNTNSGNLFKNEEKTANNPNWADYKGQCDIDGKGYWISAWIKVGKPGTKNDGKKFMSLSFKPKDAQPAQSRPATQTTTVMNHDTSNPDLEASPPPF